MDWTLEDFPYITPEDVEADVEVTLHGQPISDVLPERFIRLLQNQPKLRAAWEQNSYPSPSHKIFCILGHLGWFGLTKEEAAAVHLYFYAALGRPEDGERKVTYSLRAWKRGRERLEARERDTGNSGPASQQNPLKVLAIGATEFLARIVQAVVWACVDVWPLFASGMLAGMEKLGKSWLALELALCLATASPFLGKFPVPRKLKVLWWEEEDGEALVHRRTMQLLKGRERPAPTSEWMQFLVGHGLKLDSPEGFTKLQHEVETFRPDVVFVCNLREVHEQHENQPEMGKVRDALRQLERTFGITFVVIHHFRKERLDQVKRGTQMLAGSGIMGAWVSAWVWLTPGSSDDVAVLDIGSKHAPGTGKFLVQRTDRTDLDPIVVDEQGRPTWPVMLTVIDPKGKADQTQEDVLAAVVDHQVVDGVGITVEQITQKTGKKDRTVKLYLGRLLKTGAVQKGELHGSAHTWVPSPELEGS